MKKLTSLLGVLLLFSPVCLDAQTQSAKSGKDKKVLITYFTLPESNGVDANSGASRIIANEKLYGNTEYIARQIADITGGKLFQIRTERPYPDKTHKELIEYAKMESESKAYPKMIGKIHNFKENDVVFVG